MASISLDLILESPRCLLRAVSAEDIPFVWSATRYDGFNDGMRWGVPGDPGELIEACRRDIEMWQAGRAYTFTSVRKSNALPLGRVAIRAEPRAGDWSVGFWVHPQEWGRGYAAEAAQAVVDFGFSRLGATLIRAAHAAWNAQSRRVIEKLGMRFMREIPDGFEKNGRPVPEFEYALERTWD